jgi:Winged helix DNA-binding domain
LFVVGQNYGRPELPQPSGLMVAFPAPHQVLETVTSQDWGCSVDPDPFGVPSPSANLWIQPDDLFCEVGGRLTAGSQDNRIAAVFAVVAGQARAKSGVVMDTGFQPVAVESPPVRLSESWAAARPDDLAVTAERCTAQLLGVDPAGSAEEVAGRLLAIQAQDPRGARLAIRARSASLSASDVDSALARRSLVVTWLNRGTLHLVRAEDYSWLHPLTTPQLRTGNSRRLAQEGVPPKDAERAVATVREALAADGPPTRSQLRERVAAAGVRTKGQAMVHILALASIRGLIVRGPVAGRDQAFVLVQDWLAAPPPAISREAALGELARRYLAGHSPAADRDLAQWAGIGLRDARLGLARCGAVQRADGLAELSAKTPRAAAALPPPLLLGAFDPLLLGWASRDPIVGPHRRIVTANGLFRPFALAGGRAVATWNIARGQVVLAPLGPLDAETRAALDTDAADVTRFLRR